MKIKYWTGTETIEVDVAVGVAAAYRESLREEWRSDKRAERHQTAVSLTQTEDVSGYLLVDLSTGDIADEMIECEDRENESRNLLKALASLKESDKNLVIAAYVKKIPLKRIAEDMGVKYQSVQDRLKVIFKKLKSFF